MSEAHLPRIVIVGAAGTEILDAVLAELRDHAIETELAQLGVLYEPPRRATYLFAFETTVGLALAPHVVEWAARVAPRAGLLAVLDAGGADERERFLATGFDDVVTAPLLAREIGARARAIDRRVQRARAGRGRLRYGLFLLDLDERALWLDGAEIALTPIELAIMTELVRARGKPLSRHELHRAAWSSEPRTESKSVENVIMRLRRKLPDPELVETVWRVGFRLTDAAHARASPAPRVRVPRTA